jgi:hypothetical protein
MRDNRAGARAGLADFDRRVRSGYVQGMRRFGRLSFLSFKSMESKGKLFFAYGRWNLSPFAAPRA